LRGLADIDVARLLISRMAPFSAACRFEIQPLPKDR
jgi:hypothetical protein